MPIFADNDVNLFADIRDDFLAVAFEIPENDLFDVHVV